MNKTEQINRPRRLRVVLISLLLITYPIIVHFNVLINNPLPTAVILISLLTVGLVMGLRSSNKWLILIFAFILSISIPLLLGGYIVEVSFLPPIFLNLILLAIFARSLLYGKTPLITRFVILTTKDITPQIKHYTRRVTQAWVAFFAIMVIESISLALFSPIHIWSIFTNFLNYVFVACMLIGEYIVRINFMKNNTHMSFLEFLRALLKIKLQQLID